MRVARSSAILRACVPSRGASPSSRLFSASAAALRGGKQSTTIDVEALLSKPTWSVQSLLPSASQATALPEISSKQLHHLLRLSALPPPTSPAEESAMRATLSSQLHFVREIQQVDTSGVEPLQSLRDETAKGDKEAELGLASAGVREALANEHVKGKFHRRVRRNREEKQPPTADWDVLGAASRKTGRYFVVEGGKDG